MEIELDVQRREVGSKGNIRRHGILLAPLICIIVGHLISHHLKTNLGSSWVAVDIRGIKDSHAGWIAKVLAINITGGVIRQPMEIELFAGVRVMNINAIPLHIIDGIFDRPLGPI